MKIEIKYMVNISKTYEIVMPKKYHKKIEKLFSEGFEEYTSFVNDVLKHMSENMAIECNVSVLSAAEAYRDKDKFTFVCKAVFSNALDNPEAYGKLCLIVIFDK